MRARDRKVDFLFIAPNSRSLAVNRKPVILALQQRGLKVGALVPDQVFEEELRALNVKLWHYSLDRHALGLKAEISRFFVLRQLVQSINPDAVLAYALKPIILGVPAARLAGVGETYCLTTGLGYLFGSVDLKMRIIRWFVAQWFCVSGVLSRVFFFQNPDDCNQLRKNWLFRRLVRSVVVNGSGVDTDEFPPSPAPVKPITFLFMGRFLREKGLHDLVEAARIVRPSYPLARFVALGSRDAKLVNSVSDDEFQQWRAEGFVQFPGRVKNVGNYLREASVVVLPSYYREGIPRALLEALSTGRPIITCDSPGCRETVEEGRNGFLVPPRSPAELADRMCRFLETPDLIRQMGQRSREIALEKFTAEQVASHMLAAMALGGEVGRYQCAK